MTFEQGNKSAASGCLSALVCNETEAGEREPKEEGDAAADVIPDVLPYDVIRALLEEQNLAETWNLLPTVAYICTLIGVGLAGNVVVLLVYGKRFKPSATRSYVLAMSVVDLVSNVLILPTEIVDIRFGFTYDLPLLCKFMRSANSLVTLTSAFLLVAVARDRWDKICRPLERHGSLRRIKINIFICLMAAVILTIPFGILNGSKTRELSADAVFTFPSKYVNNLTAHDLGNTTSSPPDYHGNWTTGDKQVNFDPSGDSHSTTSNISIATATKAFVQVQAREFNVTGFTCSVDDAYVGTWFPMAYSATMALTFLACVAIMATSYISIGLALRRHGRSLAAARSAEKPSSRKTNGKARSKERGVAEGHWLALGGKTDNPLILEDGSSGLSNTRSTSSQADGARRKTTPIEGGLEDTSSGPVTETSFYASQSSVAQDFPSGGKDSATLLSHAGQNNGSKGVVNEVTITSDDESPATGRGLNENDELRAAGAKHEQDPPHGQQQNQRSTLSSPSRAKGSSLDTTTTSTSTPPRKAFWKFTAGSSCEVRPSSKPRSQRDGRRRQKAESATAVKKIPSSTTFMMFVLTAIFIVNYLPHLVIIGLRAASGDLDRGLSGWGLNAYNVALRSYFANCAVNSLVYGFCNARFRQECKKLVCCR